MPSGPERPGQELLRKGLPHREHRIELRQSGYSTSSLSRNLPRFIEAERDRKQRAEHALSQSLASLREESRRQRAALLGQSVLSKLRKYKELYRRPHPDRVQHPRFLTEAERREEALRRTMTSRRHARDLGVDVGSLERLHEDTGRRFRELLDRRQNGRLDITTPDDGLRRHPSDARVVDGEVSWPILRAPAPDPPGPDDPPPDEPSAAEPPAPDPFAWEVHNQPFDAGWYDAGGSGEATDAGRIRQLSSNLNYDLSVSGSTVWGQNFNAGDFDQLWAVSEDGFLVWHTMAETGLLEVEADFQCALDEHYIHTSAEWGLSDIDCFTKEEAVMAVFWDFDETTLASETLDGNLSSGFVIVGGGEQVGIAPYKYPVASGEMRTVHMFSQAVFPAGATLLVYVGTRQRIGAFLNDVSLNTWVNSTWFLTEIRIRQG